MQGFFCARMDEKILKQGIFGRGGEWWRKKLVEDIRIWWRVVETLLFLWGKPWKIGLFSKKKS